jgi:hypothetical protein
LEIAHSQTTPQTAGPARAKSVVVLNANILSLDEKQGPFIFPLFCFVFVFCSFLTTTSYPQGRRRKWIANCVYPAYISPQ